MDNLAETRVCLETELVALCAKRITEENLSQLGDLISQMDQSLERDGEDFLDLDLQFHLMIADSSRNPVLAQLLRTIRTLLAEYLAKSQQLPGVRARAAAEHKLIFEAIRERSSQKARDLMRDHLEKFHRDYTILTKAAESIWAKALGSGLAPESGK